jgi:hypothetical protein
MNKWDAFISHASEDKAVFVNALSNALIRRGLKVWIDQTALDVGVSLRRSIEAGLNESRFGVVVMSPAFFAKQWPQKELDALYALEQTPGSRILPVWYNLSIEEVKLHAPLMADRVALRSDMGIETIADKLAEKILNSTSLNSGRSSVGTNTSGSQHIYLVTCPICGGLLEIVNPKINIEPQTILISNSDLIGDYGRNIYVRCVCPHCQNSMKVELKY